ncbi:MAG: endonuclease/exonuclease/phosphatase family protein [Byssovorax sp.]
MLTVLSWNVLSDAYVRPGYFPHTDPALLAPGVRTPRIVARLVALAPDVVCLQEVEPALFEAVRAALAPLGFSGRFLQKRRKPDGCATFVRRAALAIESFQEMAYPDGAPDRADSGHVALLSVLHASGQRIGVANTHLKWDDPGTPDGERWALRQAPTLLAAVQATEIPWILCGDFNVTPDSPVHRLITAAGYVDAYASLPGARTSNANEDARRIDYLFHAPELRVEPAPIPPIDDVTPLPSETEPSDHLAIAGRFTLD